MFGEIVSKLYSVFQGYLQLNLFLIEWLFVFGLLFFAVLCLLRRKGYTRKCQQVLIMLVCNLMLSLNCSFVFVMTLFGRTMGEAYRYELMPFESYMKVVSEGNMEILLQILVNVAMYIPIGFLLPCCFKLFERYRYIIFVAIISSAGIELVQGIFKMGLFEVDDIINNTIGVNIGFVIYMICVRIRRHYFKESIINEK